MAEDEIYCLKQSLDDEEAKSDRLAKEIAHLKSGFSCENIVSTDKIGTKEVRCRGNGLEGHAESDHKSAVTHEPRCSSVVSTSLDDREIFEEHNCQVLRMNLYHCKMCGLLYCKMTHFVEFLHSQKTGAEFSGHHSPKHSENEISDEETETKNDNGISHHGYHSSKEIFRSFWI